MVQLMKKKPPPTPQELEQLKTIYRLRRITLIVFLLFLPICIGVSSMWPRAAAPFSIAYLMIAAIPAGLNNYAKCPRCGKYFNMFDPFDWELHNVAPNPGPRNCVYCKFPFNRWKQGRAYRFVKKMIEIFPITLCFFIPPQKKTK